MPDTFEELMASLANLSEFDRKSTLKDTEGRCICPECRTYTECAKTKEELLFCIDGRSPDCITKPVECICPTCPVEIEFNMKNMYYCIEGGEADKRKRKAERLAKKAQKGP